MVRLLSILFSVGLALTACTSTPPTGNGGISVYKISPRDEAKIQFRMLDSVNALRQARGVAPLQLNAELTAAAATHARDMSVQNRPWHFGSDGSSPIDRVRRSGYNGILKGENISETFETELETLSAWMEAADTRDVILDPSATHLGFAWLQEKSGKLWWCLVTGGPGVAPTLSPIAVVASE
ncbi:CAP domain-containing protein [Alphaproteobacteria bacterium KMM 3653]|uniref:CAP domain-containing protein n=1 Tax=Harenicola maris TaxID=2841044 RepID=A0AAP2CNV6_9RHOB|nr:CAP domain-containing protein [Harenicola maris]